MVSEWVTVRAADFIEFNPRLSIKKGALATKVAMDKLQPFTKKIPATEQAEFAGGSKFCNGDTIMARITPCLENGKTAFVDILADGEVAFGSTEFIVMRARVGVSDPQFIYYLATSPAFRNIAIKSMVGSSGRQRVQQGVLDELELTVPPLEEQQKIGALLALMDEKIALNNKINDNLQQQAQTLFAKQFCLRSDDPVPQGWALTALGDVAVISNKSFNPIKQPATMLEHYSIPAFDETRYPVFELSTEIKSNKFIVDADCFMISKLNPTTKRVWRPYCMTQNAVCSTEFIVYKVKDKKLIDFLYSLIDSSSFSNYMCSHVTGSTGSRQRTIPSDTLQYKFYLPTDKEIAAFSTVVSPMYEQIRINAMENARLKALRDSLLPRLMSGEVDVSDIDI
ncbi:MAG: restriction endonuclease subunit S [Acutalibacteraceae bacterium]